MTLANLPRHPSRRYAAVAAVAFTVVAGYEGLSLSAYPDSVAKATICYGETRGVKIGDVATKPECDAKLMASLAGFASEIDKCMPDNIPDASYIAMLSASYNIGVVAFCSSSMSRHALAGSLQAACDSLLAWDKITVAGIKVRSKGLARRRAEERAMCLSGLVTKEV